MTQSNRRTFMLQVAAGGSALLATQAHAQAKVEESDPQAKALGYVHDTTLADKKKYAKHTNDQHCGNCALFQGKAGDKWAGCPLFGTKQVAFNGWCSAWAKKA